jgi:membrane protease YdiL (CAAX protease family)
MIASAIRRRPVTAWVLWFFTVGQAFAFTPLVLERAGIDPGVPPQAFILASTLVGLLLPALVITALVDGPAAAVQLWRRAFAVRVGWRWFAVAVLGVPVLAFATTAAALGAPEVTSPSAWTTALLSGLALQLLLTLLPNNLWEEVAWAGFFQDRLQRRRGPASAAVLAGVLFGLQHVALVVGNPPATAVLTLAALVVVVIPFRFLTAAAYNATNSLLVVGLLHGMGNAVAGGSGFGAGLLPRLYPGSTLPAAVHLLVFAVLGLVALALTRGRLGASDPTRNHIHDRETSR